MKIEVKPFVKALARSLPQNVTLRCKFPFLFVFARFPLRTDFLRDELIRAFLETLSETLGETLSETLNPAFYVKKTEHWLEQREEAGGRLYQYEVDLKEFKRLAEAACVNIEVDRVWRFIQCDSVISARLLQAKLSILGTKCSVKHANGILNQLVDLGMLKFDGRRRFVVHVERKQGRHR